MTIITADGVMGFGDGGVTMNDIDIDDDDDVLRGVDACAIPAGNGEARSYGANGVHGGVLGSNGVSGSLYDSDGAIVPVGVPSSIALIPLPLVPLGVITISIGITPGSGVRGDGNGV